MGLADYFAKFFSGDDYNSSKERAWLGLQGIENSVPGQQGRSIATSEIPRHGEITNYLSRVLNFPEDKFPTSYDIRGAAGDFKGPLGAYNSRSNKITFPVDTLEHLSPTSQFPLDRNNRESFNPYKQDTYGTMTHELTHFVQENQPKGIGGILDYINPRNSAESYSKNFLQEKNPHTPPDWLSGGEADNAKNNKRETMADIMGRKFQEYQMLGEMVREDLKEKNLPMYMSPGAQQPEYYGSANP